VAVNPNTGRVYVTNRFTNQLHIVGPGAAHTTVPLGATGFAVAANPATNHVFIITISEGQATLQVRDGDSGDLITTLALGEEDANDGGQGLAVDPQTSRVYVASYETGILYMIADAGQAPLATPTATPIVDTTTATSTATPIDTATRTATVTAVATPIGGWPFQVYLPVVVFEPGATATPTTMPTWTGTVTKTATRTATRTRTTVPTVTPTASAIDWRIPDLLHVSLVPAQVGSGQMYWRLVRAIFQDEDESGGNHNVYYRVEDENGQALLGMGVCLGFPWSPNEDCSHLTEQRGAAYPDGYGADYPIWGTGWNPVNGPGPYSAWVSGPPSDRVIGMGMPLNIHVNFLLTFRRSIAP